ENYAALVLQQALDCDVLGPRFTWILGSNIPLNIFNSSVYDRLTGMFTIEPVVGNVINAPFNATLLREAYAIWQQYEPETFPGPGNVNYYALFSFDATWSLILSLRELCLKNASCTSFLETPLCFHRRFLSADLLFDIINNTTFLGVSGPVEFKANLTDRVNGSYYIAKNIQSFSNGLNYVPVLVWSETNNWVSHTELNTIIWPGRSLVAPIGYALATNATLRIAVIEIPPLTIIEETKDEHGGKKTKLSGYAPDLIDHLQKQMKFKSNTTVLSSNRTYDELIEAVANNTYDMIVGDITIIATRQKRIAFSSSIYDGSLRVIIRNSSSSYLRSSSSTSLLTWAQRTLCYVGLLILTTMLLNVFEGKGWIFPYIDSPLKINTRYEPIARSISSLITCFLYMLSIISFACFTARLIVELATPKSEVLISGIDDIKKGKISSDRVGIIANSSIEDYYLREISGGNHNFYPLQSKDDMYNKLLSNTIDAAIMDSGVLEYSTNTLYRNLTLAGPAFDHSAFGIVYPKGWLYEQDLSVSLASLKKLGILDGLKNKWFVTNYPSNSLPVSSFNSRPLFLFLVLINNIFSGTINTPTTNSIPYNTYSSMESISDTSEIPPLLQSIESCTVEASTNDYMEHDVSLFSPAEHVQVLKDESRTNRISVHSVCSYCADLSGLTLINDTQPITDSITSEETIKLKRNIDISIICLDVSLSLKQPINDVRINVELFTDDLKCTSRLLSINKNTEEKKLIYFVISASRGRIVLPLVHSCVNIERIYIHDAQNVSRNSLWMDSYSKIVDSWPSTDAIQQQLKQDIEHLMTKCSRWTRSPNLLSNLRPQTLSYHITSLPVGQDEKCYNIPNIVTLYCNSHDHEKFHFSHENAQFRVFNNVHQCTEFVDKYDISSVFLVICIDCTTDLPHVLQLVNHQSVHATYIFACGQWRDMQNIGSLYESSKVSGVFVSHRELLVQLTNDICFYRQTLANTVKMDALRADSEVLAHLIPSDKEFIRSQLVIDVLSRLLPSTNTDSNVPEYINTELAQRIHYFHKLKSELSYIYNTLEPLSSNQIRSSITVYVTQLTSNTDMNMIRKNYNCFLQFYACLTASRSYSSAVQLCRRAVDNGLDAALWEIQLTKGTTITQSPSHPDVFIFPLGTIFRLNSIKQTCDLIWHIKIEYNNYNIQPFKDQLYFETHSQNFNMSPQEERTHVRQLHEAMSTFQSFVNIRSQPRVPLKNQQCQCVWFYNKSISKDLRDDLQFNLNETFLRLQTYTERDEVTEFLSHTSLEKIFFISSGEDAENLCSFVTAQQRFKDSYIYELKLDTDGVPSGTEGWTVCNNIDDLYKHVYTDLTQVLKDTDFGYQVPNDAADTILDLFPAFELFNLTNKQVWCQFLNKNCLRFVLFRLIYQILFEMEHDASALDEMCSYFRNEYKSYPTQLKSIDKFQANYDVNHTVKYYTEHQFLYSLINQALRSEDFNRIFTCRYYISHLDQRLTTYVEKSSTSLTEKLVFHGKKLPTAVLQQLNDSRGSLISINSFLSTSKSCIVSADYTGADTDIPGYESVMFTMTIDSTTKTKMKYADITNESKHPQEREILFSVGSVWKIDDVIDGPVREVKLTFCDQIDTELEEIDQRLTNGPTFLSLGNVLRELGDKINAENHYYRMLDRPDLSGEIRGHIYYNIGTLAAEQGRYSDALKSFRLAVELISSESEKDVNSKTLNDLIYHHNIRPTRLRIWNSLGLLYYKNGDCRNARSSFEQSLKEHGHPLEKAIVHNNLGLLEFDYGNYQKSYRHHENALNLSKKYICVPEFHVNWSRANNLLSETTAHDTILQPVVKSRSSTCSDEFLMTMKIDQILYDSGNKD
ncbi:unnamed protein product, partial [Adineta ricciae]